MELILRGQHGAALRRVVGQVHALFLGHQAHHPQHLLQHRQHVHRRRRVQHTAVQPGQAQQVLGDAGKPLGLLADVGHELPGGLRVDAVGLQNGIRQQPDGRQRRFQLVGGVGHEPATGVLRGLEPVRQAVELLADLGDLVPPPDLRPVAVRALPHLADGGEQQADLLCQRLGQHQAQPQHHHADDAAEPQQVPLQSLQQCRLFRVVLISIHRADDLVLIQHRGGRPAAERTVFENAGKGVVAHQGLDDLRVQGILPHGAAGLTGVVQHLSRAVRHQDTGKPRLLHHCHGRRHVLLVQLVQTG